MDHQPDPCILYKEEEEGRRGEKGGEGEVTCISVYTPHTLLYTGWVYQFSPLSLSMQTS